MPWEMRFDNMQVRLLPPSAPHRPSLRPSLSRSAARCCSLLLRCGPQPNVWYDNSSLPAPKWRAWWSTFATCGFNNATHYPGPGVNASLPLQCQASASHCNLTAEEEQPSPSATAGGSALDEVYGGGAGAMKASALPLAKSRNGKYFQHLWAISLCVFLRIF